MANFSQNQNALTTASEVIAESVGRRAKLTILNADSSIYVYIGSASTVTSATGFPLAPGASFTFHGSAAKARVYGIAASGTPTVAVLEEYD